jgi:hypothetical protein
MMRHTLTPHRRKVSPPPWPTQPGGQRMVCCGASGRIRALMLEKTYG